MPGLPPQSKHFLFAAAGICTVYHHTTFSIGTLFYFRVPFFCCEGWVWSPGSCDYGPAEEKATGTVGGRILPKVPDSAVQVSELCWKRSPGGA